MAAASGSLSELDCPICLDGFDSSVHTPRFMPCHHTVCHSCLTDLIVHRQNQGAVKCPMCQKLALVPPEEAFGFQVNFYLERQLQDGGRSQSDSGSKDRRRCTSDGVWSRVTRQQNVRKATSMIDFSSAQHQDDICRRCRKESWNGSTECATDERGQNRLHSSTVCTKHPRENIALYCRQCKKGICIICKMTTHERHTSDDLIDVANTIRHQLRKDLTSVQGQCKRMSDTIKDLKDQKRDYRCKISGIKDDISREREASIQVLSDKSARLTSRVDDLQNKQVRTFDDEITKFKNRLVNLTTDATNMTNILETSTDTEVLDFDRTNITNRPLPSPPPSINSSPVLMGGGTGMLLDQTQTSILNINKTPQILFSQSIPAKMITATENDVLAVTETDIRKVSLVGNTVWTVKTSGVTDIVSSETGNVYVLLHQRDRWLVKRLELGSFLSDFLDLASEVDCLTSGREKSLVLGTARRRILTLEYYSQSAKWLRKVQVPCRCEKLVKMVHVGSGTKAVLFNTSAWATEVMLLNSGGQILRTFSGHQGQGGNVRHMTSFCGGLVVSDIDAGTVFLLNSRCEIASRLMDRQSVRALHGDGLADTCTVEGVASGGGGVLWLLSGCGTNTSLHALRISKDLMN